MKKLVVLKYIGIPDELLLSNLIKNIESLENGKNSRFVKRLISITIELINNFINHSKKNTACEFELIQINNKYKIITHNITSVANFVRAERQLTKIKSSPSLPFLIKDKLLKVASEKSRSLGLLKIYEKSSGNLKILKSNRSTKLVIKIVCNLHDKN